MPLVTIRLVPGVNVEKTPTLNEAGISDANFIRFVDGLPQKLGGWEKYYPFTVNGIPRSLHAWQDANGDDNLGIGTSSLLGIISADTLDGITPQIFDSNTQVNFSTTAGSPTVTVTDTNISTVTIYDSVFFETPVSVGGLILSGIYPIASVTGATSYTITAPSNAVTTRSNMTITGITQANPGVVTYSGADNIANGDLVYIYGVVGMTQVNGLLFTVANLNAGANTFELSGVNTTGYTAYSSGGTASPAHVPSFATTSGTAFVAVTLADHGLSVGDTINFPIATTVGGVTISGIYPVSAVSTVDVFSITADAAASSTAIASMNAGLASFKYYITLGPETGFSGYSIGGYGSGGYSTGTAVTVQTGTPITSTDWSLENWGDVFLSSPESGAVYYYQPNSGFANARLIDGGPIFNNGIFVSMQSQILVAYGSTQDEDIGLSQDPLLVKWSSQGNYLDWTISTTNQAGSYRLPTGSAILSGLAAPQQDLLWTDLDVWSMNYLGFPLVFGFQKIGSNCGIIGKHARVQQGGNVYWMGKSNFYMLGGSAPTPIPCTVWDFVFQDLNTAIDDDTGRPYSSRSWAWSNSPFNEVWFFFPRASTEATECDAYVKFNTLTGDWDFSPLPRACGIDQSVLGNPISATPSGTIYEHELGYDADGEPINSFFETGWYALSDGQEAIFFDWIIPDMRYGTYAADPDATLQLTMYSAMYPGDTPRVYGPYTFTNATQQITTRGRGRLVKFRISSGDQGSFWRMGGVRHRIAQDGRR